MTAAAEPSFPTPSITVPAATAPADVSVVAAVAPRPRASPPREPRDCSRRTGRRARSPRHSSDAGRAERARKERARPSPKVSRSCHYCGSKSHLLSAYDKWKEWIARDLRKREKLALSVSGARTREILPPEEGKGWPEEATTVALVLGSERGRSHRYSRRSGTPAILGATVPPRLRGHTYAGDRGSRLPVSAARSLQRWKCCPPRTGEEVIQAF